MEERKPEYENEAEYKYNIIVILIVILGFLIHSNYEKIIALFR